MFFVSLFSILLGMYLAVKLLGHLKILHLTFWRDTKHLLCAYWSFVYFSLKKYLFKFFAHFKKLGYWSFCCWVVGVLYISWTLSPCKLSDAQVFSPVLYFCHFTFLLISFDALKFIILMRSTWFDFFLLLLVLLVLYLRIHYQIQW